MSHKKLLDSILLPLIEDYQGWFERSAALLATEPLSFLSPEAQTELLERVNQAQAELQTSKLLYHLAENEVGIDPKLVAKWHNLLMECAALGRRYRQLNSSPDQA